MTQSPIWVNITKWWKSKWKKVVRELSYRPASSSDSALYMRYLKTISSSQKYKNIFDVFPIFFSSFSYRHPQILAWFRAKLGQMCIIMLLKFRRFLNHIKCSMLMCLVFLNQQEHWTVPLYKFCTFFLYSSTAWYPEDL